MIAALVLLPAAAALAALALRPDRWRRGLLLATAVTHAGLTTWAWTPQPLPAAGDWLGLDAAALIFLTIISALFLAAAIYAVHYLKDEAAHATPQRTDSGLWFHNGPEAVFTGCLLFFLGAMSLVVLARHLGLLWVAVEATTLASAPLIYFHRHDRSLEATWKYLMLCSVGIAVALLGTFFLAVAAKGNGNGHLPLLVDDLVAQAARLNLPWLKAAFLFLLIGYGTKMGLAPMHTWLPDAHSEAPSLVSALLSGALLNCAFLGILRVHQINVAAGQGAFGQDLLTAFGLLSMGVAAVFIVGQTDFKRLLAYSSVEHMGILALGLGLGGSALFGSMLHAINHSFTKGALFLIAGNLLGVYGTKTASRVQGVWRVLPVSGALWLVGFLAITGSPPFGTFVSEFVILKAALDAGRFWVAAAYLVALAIIFISMGHIVLGMVQGNPGSAAPAPRRESAWSVAPSLVLLAAVVVLGVYLPPFLNQVLHRAAALFGGS